MKYRVIVYVSIPFSSGPTFFRNPRKKWEMRDHRSLNPLLIGAYLLSERRTIKMHVERIKSQSPSHRGLPSFGEKK